VKRSLVPFCCAIVMLGCMISGANIARAIAADAPAALVVVDEQGTSYQVTQQDLATLPRKKVTVTGHDDVMAEYEGVQLADLLQ
jgi:hypothetical protein